MYLDTAVMVKLFVAEPDSEFYSKRVDHEVILTSSIAYTEFWSALLAKQRENLIDGEQRKGAWSRFVRNIEEDRIERVAVNFVILKKANWILDECYSKVRLRSLDAIHLATCDHTQEWPLCTNDRRMRQAAACLKFPLVEVAN